MIPFQVPRVPNVFWRELRHAQDGLPVTRHNLTRTQRQIAEGGVHLLNTVRFFWGGHKNDQNKSERCSVVSGGVRLAAVQVA